jgi:hypothetical protein
MFEQIDVRAREQLKDAADYLFFESPGSGEPVNVLATSFAVCNMGVDFVLNQCREN